MKKFCILLGFAISLFSCTSDQDLTFENIEGESLKNEHKLGAKSAPKVQLIKAWSQYSFYRGFNTYTRRFVVQVANIAPEKNVTIYHERLDGQWVDIPMEYSYNIDSSSEIWTLNYVHTGEQIYSDEFAIRYEVDGQVYWDSNNDEDYRLKESEGTLIPENGANILADQKFDALFPVFGTDKNQFNVVVDVKNLAPEKSVQVVYTTDGWQTQSTASLNFTSYWYNGYNYAIESPNRFDVERWVAYIQVPNTVNTIEYAVVYRVNGEEYWDNNFGRNYVVTKTK